MADETNGYQGWTNYETWCVNLWLSNDQASYTTTKEIVADGTEWEAAERLKEWIAADEFPLKEPTMYSDMLTAAFSEVNWVEIVRAFREE